MTEQEGHQESDQQDSEQQQPKPIGPSGGEEGEPLSSPEPGHPVADVHPVGGMEDASAEHPEDIGDTKSDEQGEEDVTQSPGAPADPDTPGV